MGLPAVITTGQGKEFRNKLNQELTEKFGIKHQLTTAYHPQANGLAERCNQTSVNSLAKFAQDKRETWDENVGEVVYSYNTAVQESTKHTPFESMFGWMAILPVDINAVGNYNPDDMLKQFDEAKKPDEEDSKAKRQKMEEIVKANIEKAQMKQKLHYDRKHTSFQVTKYQRGPYFSTVLLKMWALFFNCPFFQQSVEKCVPMGSNLFTGEPYISTLCLKSQFQGSKFSVKLVPGGPFFM